MTNTPRNYVRRSHKTMHGAVVNDVPGWLVEHASTPAPVRRAFAELDAANLEGRALHSAIVSAGTALSTFESDVRRKIHRGESPDVSEREPLTLAHEVATGALAAHVLSTYRLACAAEDALLLAGSDLRRVAAMVAAEAHAETVSAWSTATAALDRREAAYGYLGRPGSGSNGEPVVAPLDWQRVAGMFSRAPLSRRDVDKMVSGFPLPAVEVIADGAA
jgi:hypothetical protein